MIENFYLCLLYFNIFFNKHILHLESEGVLTREQNSLTDESSIVVIIKNEHANINNCTN